MRLSQTRQHAPQSPKALGWKIATFGLERLQPAADYIAGSSAVWNAYCEWCTERNEVPLAFAVFQEELDKVARAAGIQVQQSGGHILFQDVRIAKETPA